MAATSSCFRGDDPANSMRPGTAGHHDIPNPGLPLHCKDASGQPITQLPREYPDLLLVERVGVRIEVATRSFERSSRLKRRSREKTMGNMANSEGQCAFYKRRGAAAAYGGGREREETKQQASTAQQKRGALCPGETRQPSERLARTFLPHLLSLCIAAAALLSPVAALACPASHLIIAAKVPSSSSPTLPLFLSFPRSGCCT